MYRKVYRFVLGTKPRLHEIAARFHYSPPAYAMCTCLETNLSPKIPRKLVISQNYFNAWYEKISHL